MESDVPFNLIAESNNPSPISFSSSNPSVISVSNKTDQWIATIIGSGVAKITDFQAADDQYNEAILSQTVETKVQLDKPTNNISFDTFPNPFTNRLTINFKPVESGHAKLIVYDLQGSVVKVLFAGQVTAGNSMSFTLNANGLTTGLYIVNLKIGSEKLIKKVIYRHS